MEQVDLNKIFAAAKMDNQNAASATPTAPLALPAPTKTGNLDMSKVNKQNNYPVIGEALGNIGRPPMADNGRDENRYGGRAFKRSGSRSRSPARREMNPGGHNPYIDQRRDDARGRTNGRNRSASPQGRGAVQGMQAYKRERSPLPGQAADNNTEIIDVESTSVGLIIGKNGENLKRVEGETGARVQFIPDKGAPMRQCKISGTARQRSEAKDQIHRIIEQNPRVAPARVPSQIIASPSSDTPPVLREGELSSQISVPDKTVGLIIGRGGETIRDIQGKSGCHVNIVQEHKSVNGMRPVNLIGTPEAAAMATKLINEIVKSDIRGQAGASSVPDYGQQTHYDAYNKAGTYDTTGGNKIHDSIVIPSDAVGMVIGKAGETIRDIQNSSGAKINVDAAEGADVNRTVRIIGSRQAIDSAKTLIWEKVDTVRAKQGGFAPNAVQYGDQYAQYQAQTYSSPAAATQGQVPPAQTTPTQAGEYPDPYAAYGGYANYFAMWQAIQAAQGGQGLPPSGA